MRFSRQEYQSGLPCPPPEALPNPGIKLVSLLSPALAGRFFSTSRLGSPHLPISIMLVVPPENPVCHRRCRPWRRVNETDGSLPSPLVLLEGCVKGLSLNMKEEKVLREREFERQNVSDDTNARECMGSEQTDFEERVCAESPLYRGARVLGETKTSRGHVGTDGLDGMQVCAGHCRANSFLELVCPSLYLQLNTLEVFTPHLAFPKRPPPIFSSYFVVVNHSLSACIFYVGA